MMKKSYLSNMMHIHAMNMNMSINDKKCRNDEKNHIFLTWCISTIVSWRGWPPRWREPDPPGRCRGRSIGGLWSAAGRTWSLWPLSAPGTARRPWWRPGAGGIKHNTSEHNHYHTQHIRTHQTQTHQNTVTITQHIRTHHTQTHQNTSHTNTSEHLEERGHHDGALELGE